MSAKTAFAALAALVAFGDPAWGQTTADLIAQEEEARLQQCLDLIERDSEAAYEFGLRWQGEGSRPPARFCVAMALIAREHFEEGAIRLETLANAPDGGSMERRLVYLSQAGNAWIMAQRPAEAEVALSNALKLAPSNPGLLTDRASAYIMGGKYREAIGDLNVALEQIPDYPDALFLRAKAFLATDRLRAAFADVELAREVDPENIELLVLRGDIREAIRIKEDRR